ncbi:hypothetical protein [Streptomyces daliensis]|uniref:Uncharacterized protein n=1 Tax=Streptomyces daliensis TaxID=299421 RepID=A0A8T4ITB6_9ACTN|nr:hypothetical protein [Streptomyces daliensis]
MSGETTPRYPLGPCRTCGRYGPDVEVIPKVPQEKGRVRDVLACAQHAPTYIASSRDLEWLARRRSAATGEAFEEALTVLRGVRQQAITTAGDS